MRKLNIKEKYLFILEREIEHVNKIHTSYLLSIDPVNQETKMLRLLLLSELTNRRIEDLKNISEPSLYKSVKKIVDYFVSILPSEKSSL